MDDWRIVVNTEYVRNGAFALQSIFLLFKI